MANKGNVKEKLVFLDNKGPNTGIVIGDNSFFVMDTLFINSKTGISFIANDYGSGVQETFYSIDQGTPVLWNNEQIYLEDEKNHHIFFKSTDNVWNEEQTKESQVYVDNSPPIIYINFSIKQICQKEIEGKEISVYPNYTRMYIGATDKHCGTEKILYSINDGSFVQYSSPYTLDISETSQFSTEKLYNVKVKAEDKLGNTSVTTVEFYISNN